MAIAQSETSITLCTGVVEIGVWKAYTNRGSRFLNSNENLCVYMCACVREREGR